MMKQPIDYEDNQSGLPDTQRPHGWQWELDIILALSIAAILGAFAYAAVTW